MEGSIRTSLLSETADCNLNSAKVNYEGPILRIPMQLGVTNGNPQIRLDLAFWQSLILGQVFASETLWPLITHPLKNPLSRYFWGQPILVWRHFKFSTPQEWLISSSASDRLAMHQRWLGSDASKQ